MREEEFFNEQDTIIAARINCPSCWQTHEYKVRWRRRLKKKTLPPRASDEDRRRFARMRSYMVRIDDTVRCLNPRCGKKIEITSLPSVALLEE